jgi:Transposase zinc-binding domain
VRSASTLPVSGARSGTSHHGTLPATCLPPGRRDCRLGQDRHRPHVAAQLRHPSFGAGRGHPGHPRPAGPPAYRFHLSICSGRGQYDPTGKKSPGGIEHREAASGIVAGDAPPKLEVADVFRRHGEAWRSANIGHVSLGQLRVMSAIEACRTSALGGHVERCEDCAHTRVAYNSCRNRHCPKCQWSAAAAWLAAREAELLPVPLFPCGVHAAGADRRHRLPEQGQGLRSTVQGCSGDAYHDRGRIAAASLPSSCRLASRPSLTAPRASEQSP